MGKLETLCDVMKSDSGPAIAGIGAVAFMVGGYYFSRRGYKAEVKKGDSTVTISPQVPESKTEKAL